MSTTYRYHGHTHEKARKLFVVDFIVILVSVWLASIIDIWIDIQHIMPLGNFLHYQTFLFILLMQLMLLALGLYELRLRETGRGIFRRILVAIGVTYFIADIIVMNLVEVSWLTEYTVALASIVTLVLLTAFRVNVYDSEWFGFSKRKVLVLGTGERASIIEKRMRRKADRRGIELFGFVRQPGDTKEGIKDETVLTLEEDELIDYVIDNHIEEVVVACDERRNSMPLRALFDFKIRGVQITEILDFIERETGQIAVTLIYPSWVIYSNGFSSTNHLREAVDYLFNAVLAVIVLVFTWPLILIAAIAIYLDDGYKKGRTLLYTQERVGEAGQIFRIMKFRSMKPDAEKGGAQFATKNDDRTTRIGAFLRKYRIDELPQLFNVLKGEMGFVGPRPERPEFVKEYVLKIPYYNQRHNVKPGLTGWAQLKYPYGATDEDTLEKLKFDLYYIKHRSILLDLLILVRTAEVVLFGKGR